MSNWQNQIIANSQAIQQLINQSKQISDLEDFIYEESIESYIVLKKQNEQKSKKLTLDVLISILNEYVVSTSRRLIIVNNNEFELVKNPSNESNELEVNDMIVNGYWINTEFWYSARFLGGDKNVKDNWQILSSIEEIPLT